MSGELILIIDDEVHILELIRYNLEKEGYRVIVCETGEEGLNAIETDKPDLLILDLMLPQMDGLEVCSRIRGRVSTASLPVIMLTARGEEIDRVLGLEMGADDYLTKPFSTKELIARVRAVLRRSSRGVRKSGVISIGDIDIDIEGFRVYKNKREIDLTNKEYELLKTLALNHGRILTRDYLLDKVWGYGYNGDTRTIDVHIRHLRRKIEEDDGNPRYIHTARGIGYSLNYKGDEHV